MKQFIINKNIKLKNMYNESIPRNPFYGTNFGKTSSNFGKTKTNFGKTVTNFGKTINNFGFHTNYRLQKSNSAIDCTFPLTSR